MNRITGFLSLVLSLFTAVPLAGRVISYAPYTSRVAIPSHQDRTSRHFVLIETRAEDFFYSVPRDVVLYDSTGAEEPRVITPSPAIWQQSALYQKNGGTPVILLMTSGTLMMSEGGTHWRAIQGLGSFQLPQRVDVDSGGPFSNGLYAPVVLGNDEWPFVLSLRSNGGVWAIHRTGYAKQLAGGTGARVAGRNAAGDRFLIQADRTISIATPDGTLTKIGDLPLSGDCAGWITSGGSAYLQQLRYDGRKLYLVKGGEASLVAEGEPAYAPESDEPVPLRLFAVPTHDYEGAWILERATEQPTTLSRHTPSGGSATMWSDDAAPQVEALIAGASGDTVLIQVHRDRSGADLATPIIDPALAVWRVGQPAPRAYDELYLKEQWNKGFVVVDADRIESGDAFVFNSGFKEIPAQPSRVSAPISGGGDVVQEWGVVRGSLKQRLVLPGVVRASGAYNSYWRTDVVLYNPVDEPQIVDVRYVPLGVENTLSATVTLGPREIRAIPDVLATLFSASGGGSLHLLPQIGINATARTYTRGTSSGYYQGTFGYGMHAVDAFTAAGPRFPVTFSGAFPDPGFRTNVLLTDTSGRGAHANLRTLRAWSSPEMVGEVGTLAAGAMQAGVAAPARLHPDSGVALVVEPTRGTAIATVVAIDNRSNDAMWIPPDVPGTVPRTIPVIGHVTGAGGAQFRSDLYLHNPRGGRYVNLTVRLWDRPWIQQSRWVYVNGRETMIIRDVLWTLFGYTGLAQLRYASPEGEPGEGVRVTSRAYTIAANGGTYGCLVPPLNGFQIATRGDRLEILGVGGGSGFRTNVGLIDLAGDSGSDPLVRLSLIGSGNVVLDRWEIEVPANGGIQLSDIFRARGITTVPAAALLVVENVTGEQIAAYATLVDNWTNDSTYLTSQLGARETN